MKNFNNIEDFANNLVKGSFGLYVVAISDKKMNKFPVDGGMRVANPYIGRVFNLAFIQNACTGVGYRNLVKSECLKEGIAFTDAEFDAAFPHEGTYAVNVNDKFANMILQHERTQQRYLRLLSGRKRTKTKYFTILTDSDGNNPHIIDADSEEYKEIMRYVPAKRTSPKQEALGIRNIVEVKQYKLENIVALYQGEKLYTNPNYQGLVNEPTIHEDLLTLFRKK